eukprot:scaffold253834_cov48-Prasinocladus_malaysianus.AAC.1
MSICILEADLRWGSLVDIAWKSYAYSQLAAVYLIHWCTADRPTSIQHWQLRDLVSCPYGPEDIYTVHEASTIKYNTTTGR